MIFLLLTFPFSLFPNSVSAQTATTSATFPSSLNLVPSSIPPTSPAYTDLLVHNMFHTFSCLMSGYSIIGQQCLTYQVTRDAQGVLNSVPIFAQANLSGGALGATTSLIGALYANPPVRTADYLATVGEDLGIKTAQAQVVGSGQAVLNPILRLWQVSRNIAYLLMILVFVIIGLMVMFRQRINPQTVVTAQAAIPGLVIGLVLITFSYFLAALLVDMAFIGTNVIGFYFVAAQQGDPISYNLVESTKDKNVLFIVGNLMEGITKEPIISGVQAILQGLGNSLAGGLVKVGIALGAFQFGATFGSAIGALALGGLCLVGGFTAVACGAVGSAAGPLVVGGLLAAGATANPAYFAGTALWFLAMIIIIYSMLRLLLRLINNFISIIFLVITAPFHFMAASLPGRQVIATAWIFNMLCNVLAFPAVITVFYFVNYLLGSANTPGSPFQIISPTGIALTNSATLPLFGGLEFATIKILMAFGAIIATPAIPDIICRTIGRVGVAGQLIGQEIGTETASGNRYYGIVAGEFGTAERGFGGAMGTFRTTYGQPQWNPLTGRFEQPEIPPLWRRIGRRR